MTLKNLILKYIKHPLFLCGIISIAFFSCVESYVANFTADKKITIVEGSLTNLMQKDPIILKESQPSATGGINVTTIIGAKVSLIVNGKTTIELNEKEAGAYYYPDNFKGEIGSTYQLKFVTPTGQFESTIETLLKPTPIGSVYSSLQEKGLSDAKGKTSPAFYVYVDTPNAVDTEDYFMWDWNLYEKQTVCQTCIGGYYYREPLPYGKCVSDPLLSRYNNIFDYVCENPCWENIYSSDITIGSDQFYNGKTIKGQLVAKLPLYSRNAALVDVRQFSISKAAYKFLELTRKQGVETGGLADTPPASLVGNVTCVSNASENVSGYFIVSGVENYLYWLDKKELEGKGLIILGLLGGREIKYEPSGPNTTRPPLAPCIVGKTRTNIKPNGWID